MSQERKRRLKSGEEEKSMWNFKSCPRCVGDIYIDKSEGKWYQSCLQCGFEKELPNIIEDKKQLTKKDTAKAI